MKVTSWTRGMIWALVLSLVVPFLVNPPLVGARATGRLPAAAGAAASAMPALFSADPTAGPRGVAYPTDAWPDLRLAVEPGRALPGSVVTYTLWVTNTTPGPLSGLVLADPLPATLVFVAARPDRIRYTATDHRLTWQPDPLAAGAGVSATVAARLQGAAAGDVLSNTVTMTGAGLPEPQSVSARLDVIDPHDADFEFEPGAMIRGAQIQLYSRSIAYTYPFDLPPGRGGLTPQLGLSYSSSRHRRNIGHYSLVGHGWDILGANYVARDPDNLGNITLVIDGTSYTIVTGSTPGGDLWVVKENPFIKVVSYQPDVTVPNCNGSGVPCRYVILKVKTPDGTLYQFQADRRVSSASPGANHPPLAYIWTHHDPATGDLVCDGSVLPEWVRIPLHRIEDSRGNVIDFGWEAATSADAGRHGTSDRVPGPDNCHYTRTIRLTRVSYNGGRVVVDLTYPDPGLPGANGRWDRTEFFDRGGGWHYYAIHHLTQVTVKVDGAVVHAYALAYAPQSTGALSSTTLALTAVHDNTGGAARTTQFTYEADVLVNFCSYTHLATLENAYGGRIAFTADPRSGDCAEPDAVLTRTESDAASGYSATWHYQGSGWQDDAHGFARVVETLPDGSATVHQFHQLQTVNGREIDHLSGREKKTEVCDWLTGAGQCHTVLATNIVSWTHTTADLPFTLDTSGWAEEKKPRFVYRSGIDTYLEGQAQVRSTYDYDIAGQSNKQYGNLTRVREFMGMGAGGWAVEPLRTTRSTYSPDESTWILRNPRVVEVSGQDSMVVSRSELTYNAVGLLTQRRTGTGPVAVESYAYDGYGNPVEQTDPIGHTTRSVYDDQFHTFVVCVIDAANKTSKTRYYGVAGSSQCPGSAGSAVGAAGASFGKVEETIDPLGAVTAYRYDGRGRLAAVIRPYDEDALPTRRLDYFDGERPFKIKETPKAGPVVWTYLDGFGRTIQVQQQAVAATSVRASAYTWHNQVDAASVPYLLNTAGGSYDAGWRSRPQTTYVYDRMGRPARVTHPDGSRVLTGYRALPGLLQSAIVDENGHQVVQETDSLGRLLAVNEYAGQFAAPNFGATPLATVSYAYNIRDQLVDVWDAAGHHSWMTYDGLGRKVGMHDADMGTWQYAYDAAGNLTAQTDSRGCTTSFSYDTLNRVTAKSFSGTCAASALGYSYDASGRRTGMLDGSGSTSWVYDARGRVTQEVKRVAGTDYATGYVYDPADRVTRLIYPSPGYEEVNVEYNAQGLPRRLYSSVEYVSAASYDAAGRLVEMTLGNGLVSRRSYYAWDAAGGRGRLARLTLGSLLDLGYAYDAVGNITQMADAVRDERQCFAYDARDRLVRAYTGNPACSAPVGGAGSYDEAYAYSADGNLLRRGEPGNGGDGLLVYEDAAHPHAATGYRGNQYAYGSNGNQYRRVVEGVTFDLAYDAQNRLAQVNRLGGEVTRFVYDGDGARVVQEVTVGGASPVTATTVYVGGHYEVGCAAVDVDCSGRVDIRDVQRVAARGPGTGTLADLVGVGGSWNTAGGGAQVVKHYYLGGTLIATRRGGVLYYVHADHLGSVSLVTDAGGQVVAGSELRRQPYGTVRVGSEYALPAGQSFTGQRVDLSTGLDYYGARYYDPLLARFIQPDTIVPEPGNPQALNRYAYALHNPLKYRDPGGHWIETAWDIGNIIWDVAEVRRDPSLLNIGALVLDVGAAVLPLVPAGAGIVARGGKAAKAAVEVASHADEAVDALRAASVLNRTADLSVDGKRILQLLHGTRHGEEAFAAGIDVSRGLGQLGPGFYTTFEHSSAEWFARVWQTGPDTPRLLKLDIPEAAFSGLKTIELSADSAEYWALTRAWQRGEAIPKEFRYLIDDYDAILATMAFDGRTAWQLKFNPRAQEFLNRFAIGFDHLP